MFSLKLFLVYLIVTSCIKVGHHEVDGQERIYSDQKKCHLNNIKSVLIEKSFVFVEAQKRRKWTGKKKGRSKRKEKKVGPFLFIVKKRKLFCYCDMSIFYNFLGTCVDSGNTQLSKFLNFFNEKVKTQKLKLRSLRDIFEMFSFLKYLRRDAKTLQGVNKCKTELGSKNKIFQRCSWPRAGGIKDLIDLIRSKTNSDIDHEFVRRDNRNLPAFDRGDFSKTKTKITYIKRIVKLSIVVSLAAVLSAIIYLMLLKQNVEKNPGEKSAKPDLEVVTYNCNGLANQTKLKRVLLKSAEVVNRGGIVFLQETHVVDTGYVEILWKHKFLSNCVRTNSAGVMILYGSKYELVKHNECKEGRSIVAAIKSQEISLILVNAYFPNDHVQGKLFAEKLYDKLWEMQNELPEFLTILGGDFNTCISDSDFLNRNRTSNELILAEVIKKSNKETRIYDAFRMTHSEDGFTWKRGNTYSRLDYLFVSEVMIPKITEAKIDWAFDKSDHAAVIIKFKVLDEPVKGPGIIKVNVTVLEDPVIAKEVEVEIKEMMSQSLTHWDPHTRLEFLKTVIRSVMATKSAEVKNELRETIKERSEALNYIEGLKVKLVKNEQIDTDRKAERQNILDSTLASLREQINKLRNTLDGKMMLAARAKWFEYGEKSNKFFMNLNKSKQNQRGINEIRDGGVVYRGQEKVSECITEFYRKLYSKENLAVQPENDNFYENCPKLSNEQMQKLDSELNLNELKVALFSTKESSPGPDGIPYSIYKRYWSFIGPIILEAWKYSVEMGSIPRSHRESVITLLPKEGKDVKEIKNWRPITLSNCDAKIITKALSNRVSLVLEDIVDKSQTAYVPGRSVADNLRTNFFFKRFSKINKIDSVLISLDAKKAFDSVDHKYIETTLKAYGFGPGFVNVFKILYKEISSRILINGYMSESIPIERGVKQGDALSCAIFIICIDPLLRNINSNKLIKEIKIKSKRVGMVDEIFFKGAAFADDVSVICENTKQSIQQVFVEYERLTTRSGLELNADKTEILCMNGRVKTVTFEYCSKEFQVKTVETIKICGLFFAIDENEEYKMNVVEKTNKMVYKMKIWSKRNLSMEGKILIVKSFGISQLIYNMQSYGFEKSDKLNIEREIFKFLWSTAKNQNGIDRIKRSVMKNDLNNGGMNVTDVECLDRALKLRQFIRASRSKHVIARIQEHLCGNAVRREYCKLTKHEPVCFLAMDSLNVITDHNRSKLIEADESDSDWKYKVEDTASIDVQVFLKRRNRVFHSCMMNKLNALGINSLGELLREFECEMCPNLNKLMKMILVEIPNEIIQIATCFNEEIHTETEYCKVIRLEYENWKNLMQITTKEFQQILKEALKRTEKVDFESKLEVNLFEINNIAKFRTNCKNTKLRNIFFRLIHNDFYTYEKMARFKMSTTNSCPRCGQVETTQHLFYQCTHSGVIWGLYNNLMKHCNYAKDLVSSYEDIFRVPDGAGITLIKIKVIQNMIQIARPKDWTDKLLSEMVNSLIRLEKHNYNINRNMNKFDLKWGHIERRIASFGGATD